MNKTLGLASVVSVVGGFLLLEAADPTNAPPFALVTLVLGWALLIGTAVLLYRRFRAGKDEASADEVPLHEWPFARFLSRGQAASTLFLGLRVFLGWQWLHAGWDKLNNPAWMNGGTALRGFWTNAVAVPAPPARPAITYPLYRAFLQALLEGGHERWFTYLIVFGEILIGLGILLGGLTAIAAFFAVLMNFSFLYAGTVSSNPTLLLLALAIIYCWRTAGWIGLDRWFLRVLGTPWERYPKEPRPTGGTAPAPA
jgi:thiosulfate dehydrogenase [quinone] large subunit